MKIILDTNFLLIVEKFKIDIFEEFKKLGNYKLYTLDSVVCELEKLNKGCSKVSISSNIALELIKRMKINVLKTSCGRTPDQEFLFLNDFLVATQDRALRKKLKEKNIKTIYAKQMRYLVID